MKSALSVDLHRVSRVANGGLVAVCLMFGAAGHYLSFYFHFLTVPFFLLALVNLHWRYGQRRHTLLANFGFLAQFRYLIESVGPEFRQYLYASDTEGRPFNRMERAEVYRKAKGIDSSSAFGTLRDFEEDEIKLRNSFFPLAKGELEDFEIVVGAARGLKSAYPIRRPLMISAMSYGALGEHAVRALARGAKLAGTIMNTGEGGFPKYHLMEGCDLIFQMGTAKFGVRSEDGLLDESKLAELAALEQIKMIEIKFSQGAKPGKGGLLPKEKVTEEISKLRGIPCGEDAVSPARHTECVDAASTVRFIQRVQQIGGLPTGIKFCLGRPDELHALIREMKQQDVFPDFITVDGGEGGTGAAPRSFMDEIGMPIFEALPIVDRILREEGVRERVLIFSAGKLISAGMQLKAISLGADVVYSARGFLLALGCVQALQCNRNTCPTGITTHDPRLQRGLDIDEKARRVANYVEAVHHDQSELLAAMGKSSSKMLSPLDIHRHSRIAVDAMEMESA